MGASVVYPLPLCEHVVQGEGEVVSVPHFQEVQCGKVSECIFGRCWELQEGELGNGWDALRNAWHFGGKA